jgi:hypothetical protein
VGNDRLGVAVIGAGMAGRSHAAGYRSATTCYGAALPPVDLVAIADVNGTFAADTARRFGYARAETSWQAVAEAPDVDVVSVVVANHLHREVVEGLLAAGKHVLCEKPFAPTVADAEAMVAAAARAPSPPPARTSAWPTASGSRSSGKTRQRATSSTKAPCSTISTEWSPTTPRVSARSRSGRHIRT